MNISNRLKQNIQSIHKDIEDSKFIQSLFSGKLSKERYFYYIQSLLQIYNTLEIQITRHKDSPYIQPIYFRKIFRTNFLEKDIQYLSDLWKFSKAPIYLDSLNEYKTRINSIFKRPHLLIAHCYVRYMGDLSGGQILKKVVKNHYLQDENKGFSFYIFPIDNISILKNSYKDSLNSIQLTEEEQKEVIQESISAFEYNYKLFQELEKI